jgi:hypothetical protein
MAALSRISFYIEARINAEESIRASVTERDGAVSSEYEAETLLKLRSGSRLAAARYAEDPWINPATGAWERRRRT